MRSTIFFYPQTSEQFGLVIILHSKVFRHSVSGARGRRPTPTVLWDHVHSVVNNAILEFQWELPSLQQCEETSSLQ